jgi:GTPase SAR1 family protein
MLLSLNQRRFEAGMVTLAEGEVALQRLIKELTEVSPDWTEADTRFRVIDRLIADCLGWPRETIRLERTRGREASDYELGIPRQVIWEAKREGITFDLPAGYAKSTSCDLRSLIRMGGAISEAIEQVRGYCVERGVEIAVVTNGRQLIAFLASRRDGIAPLDGQCLIFSSLELALEHFPRFWQCLSPQGIAENRLSRFLRVGEEHPIPPKVSDAIAGYPKHRPPTDLQASLKTISELLLIDAVVAPDAEQSFYEECYCESGALAQDAMISKQILMARYDSLFDADNNPPTVRPVTKGPRKPQLTPEIVAEAITQRPIVLVGDVGVGKSSFIKHLRYVSAFKEFREAISIYIDLGSEGALTSDLRRFVLQSIKEQLRQRYHIDVEEENFVKGVYALDIQRFSKQVYGYLEKENPPEYRTRLAGFLDAKVQAEAEHIRSSILHLVKARRKLVIIVIDNADQRDYDVQQQAFVIAQNCSTDWSAAVFVALRPHTFHTSRQAGAFSAYAQRVFTISPPRIDELLTRRLVFALKMAEGRVRVEKLQAIGLRLGSIATFIRVLLHSFSRSPELGEFLFNITGGNVRSAIEIVAKYMGCSNVDAENIIRIQESGSEYLIPIHEFWRPVLRGDALYYDSDASIAYNLFELWSSDPKEHFLASMLLGFLNMDGEHRLRDGYVKIERITSEMQSWGFNLSGIENVLRGLNNKKLVETPKRITFAEDHGRLSGDILESFRISTIGAYHLSRWIGEFSYLDAVSLDTPLFDKETYDGILLSSGLGLAERLSRAEQFKAYLTNRWVESNLAPSYFNWDAAMHVGDESFARVRRALVARGQNRE